MGIGAIEAVQRYLHQPLSSRSIFLHYSDAVNPHILEGRLQRCCVKVLFALEVVIEKRFVYAGFLGNLLGARPGQTVGAELPDSGVENAGAGLVGAFGLGAGWGGNSHIH